MWNSPEIFLSRKSTHDTRDTHTETKIGFGMAYVAQCCCCCWVFRCENKLNKNIILLRRTQIQLMQKRYDKLIFMVAWTLECHCSNISWTYRMTNCVCCLFDWSSFTSLHSIDFHSIALPICSELSVVAETKIVYHPSVSHQKLNLSTMYLMASTKTVDHLSQVMRFRWGN